MSPASLALVLFLVVPVATDAQTSTRHAQKKKQAGQAPAGQEYEAQLPGLEQTRAALERRSAAQPPPAAPAVAETAAATASQGAAVTDREAISNTIVRGARRAGIPVIMPIGVPPVPPPASPIR